MIFHFATVLPDGAEPASERRVARRHEPAIAERAEIFRRKKGETSDRADAADRLIAIAGADRLRGVFDDGDAGLESQCRGWASYRRFDRTDARARSLGPGVRAARKPRRIDVVGHRIDVDEDRSRTQPRDRSGAGEERKRRRDDLIARRRPRSPSAPRAARRCPTTHQLRAALRETPPFPARAPRPRHRE